MSDIAQTTILSTDDSLVPNSSTIGIEASLKIIISGTESNTCQISKTTTIGRASPSDLIIASSTLSKQHAKIIINNGQFFIMDLNSDNRTFQNKTQLQPNLAYPLHNGDEIKMGDVVCSYTEHRGSASDTAFHLQLRTMSTSVGNKETAESMKISTERDDDLNNAANSIETSEMSDLSTHSMIEQFTTGMTTEHENDDVMIEFDSLRQTGPTVTKSKLSEHIDRAWVMRSIDADDKASITHVKTTYLSTNKPLKTFSEASIEDNQLVKTVMNNANPSGIMNASTPVSYQNKLTSPAAQSMEDLSSPAASEQSALEPVSKLVHELSNINDLGSNFMPKEQIEVTMKDEIVLPLARPCVSEREMLRQSPEKECLPSSNLSRNSDPVDQLEFLRTAGLNVDQLLKDYFCWIEEQESFNADVLDYLSFVDDEKCLVYISKKLLFKAKQLTDDHGCGVVGVVKEIIADWIRRNVFPLFTFDERETEEFIKQSVTCSSYGQMQAQRDFFVYSIKQQMKRACQRQLLERLQTLGFNDDANMFLYHGTTESSAQSIIMNGIRLKTRNVRPGDFGVAFYTTEDFDAAINRAEVKAERSLIRERPALLIFQLTKEDFHRQAILRLQYSTGNEDPWIKPNPENITNNQVIQWSIFVHLCLTNNPPEQFIDQFDCIIGPTTSNLREITAGNKPQMKICGDRIGMQVAIVSTALKHLLMSGLKAVVIWDGKNNA